MKITPSEVIGFLMLLTLAFILFVQLLATLSNRNKNKHDNE